MAEPAANLLDPKLLSPKQLATIRERAPVNTAGYLTTAEEDRIALLKHIAATPDATIKRAERSGED